MRTCLLILFLLLNGVTAKAHVGSPNVFFEGRAGEYPVRVVVRPPPVVPGQAEITVCLQSETVQRITVLPVYWKAGRKGAPPPDEAQLVRGETNLYSASLWLMKSGPYSVEVTIEGAHGQSTLVVPVNSVATNTRPMARWYAAMLLTLGVLLFLGGLQIAGAAFGQSMVEAGTAPTKKDQWRGRIAMLLGGALLALLLFGGKKWWDYEDRAYRNNSLYQPMPLLATVTTDHDQNILKIKINTSNRRGEWTPLLPDHGKMMHLFLVRDGKPGAFAHLHPVAKSDVEFEVPLPPLPPDRYHVYADVTHETGFSETLTAVTTVPAASVAMTRLWMGNLTEPICSPQVTERLSKLFLPPDPDDSWQLDGANTAAMQEKRSTETAPRIAEVSGGYKMSWENPQPLVENKEVLLRFRLLTPEGQPALIEPYMGMTGHAILRHGEGTVFAHVHPAGTFSMAAQNVFTGESAPAGALNHRSHTNGIAEEISFPYAFPKAGPYRLWIQTKSEEKVLTGVFDVSVAAP